MRNILIGLILASISVPALAHDHRNYHQRHHYNYQRNNNVGVGVGLGILGLGILGATIYNQRQRIPDVCIIGYDRYNRPVYDQECFE